MTECSAAPRCLSGARERTYDGGGASGPLDLGGAIGGDAPLMMIPDRIQQKHPSHSCMFESHVFSSAKLTCWTRRPWAALREPFTAAT